MSARQALSVEAQSLLNNLLCQYARGIAHEASNLIFLEEIATSSGRSSDNREALNFVRRQARLVALALAPDAKPRALAVRELFHDLVEVINRQTSLRKLLAWELAPAAAMMQLREWPGHAQLVLQDLIEDAVRRLAGPAASAFEPLVRVAIDGNDDGIDVSLMPLCDQALPEPGALARELCAANAFGLAHEHGGATVRVWLPLADRS